MFKILLPCLFALWAVSLSAQAIVVSKTESITPNMTLTYPIINNEASTAQQIMNADIYGYVTRLKNIYQKGEAIEIAMYYEIKYEDADYVSLILKTYTYTGGAHGMPLQHGLVYSKKTGKTIPLTYFLKPISIQNLIAGIQSNRLTLTDQNMSRIQYDPFFTPNVVSKDYYLCGNGSFALIFQPYSFAPYAVGATRVLFTREAANYYNNEQ